MNTSMQALLSLDMFKRQIEPTKKKKKKKTQKRKENTLLFKGKNKQACIEKVEKKKKKKEKGKDQNRQTPASFFFFFFFFLFAVKSHSIDMLHPPSSHFPSKKINCESKDGSRGVLLCLLHDNSHLVSRRS